MFTRVLRRGLIGARIRHANEHHMIVCSFNEPIAIEANIPTFQNAQRSTLTKGHVTRLCVSSYIVDIFSSILLLSTDDWHDIQHLLQRKYKIMTDTCLPMALVARGLLNRLPGEHRIDAVDKTLDAP
jgi:hypothetical protein